METEFFFAGKPHEAALYEVLAQQLRQRLGPFDVLVQKTQLALRTGRIFTCVSLRGKGCIVVTFGLPARVASARIWQAVEPHPNRWTHHVKVYSSEEIDDELLGWLQAAYDFASRK